MTADSVCRQGEGGDREAYRIIIAIIITIIRIAIITAIIMHRVRVY